MRMLEMRSCGSVSMRGAAAMKLLLALAGLGLLAGAGVLGYVLLSSGGSDEQAVQGPSASPTAPPAEFESPPAGPYRMVIEKIGVDAPVATYGLDENRVPIVPTGPDAAQVVAWYDFSAQPATGGNAVFAGHVTWNGQAVFHSLDSLQAGDVIRLRYGSGGEVVYKVTSNQSMDPNDPATLQTIYPSDHDELTIVTCGGSFYETNDPVIGGDYTQRIVIKAVLEGVTQV